MSAEYTATSATARVRLSNDAGELVLTFVTDGRTVSIDGVQQTELGPSDLCAARGGG